MVRYLECDNSALQENYNLKFTTANTVSLTASCWYEVLFTYLSHRSPRFLVCPLQEKVPKVPGRVFPMVEHPFLFPDHSVRWTRVIIVEVMDLNDPQLSWDVKNSDVYEEIRDMDPTHPERKSFGALSAGTNFVLFEVSGREDPVLLLGSPEIPAHFIEDAESLELKMEYILKVAIARECKCPDTEEATSEAAASTSGTDDVPAKAAPPHFGECITSVSNVPAATAESEPATSVSDPVGRAVGTEPLSPTASAGAEPDVHITVSNVFPVLSGNV